MKISQYKNKLESSIYNGKILENEPLKNHTTMQAGGNAFLFLLPCDEESLAFSVKTALESELPFYILGGGSNIVFSDDGFKGAVISTSALCNVLPCPPEKTYGDNSLLLECGAGVKSDFVSKFCLEKSIGGFEAFSGLPGTAGGAVFMNARCYGDEFSNHIKSVRYLDLTDLKIKTYEFNRDDWSYKVSPFQDGKKIILSVTLCGLRQLEKGSQEEKDSRECAQKNLLNRRSKGHFDYPSAGSVFKNNHAFGKPSGQIIDDCGLKGLRRGGAQVAPWHGNFIINNGNASSRDVKNLVEEVKSIVREKTGFLLESEIIFVQP